MRGRNLPVKQKRKSRSRGRANPLVIVLVSVLVLAAGGGIAYITHQNIQQEQARQQQELIDRTVNVDTIYDGVYVDDIPLGGLTKEEAKAKVEAKQQEGLKNMNVTLAQGAQTWAFTSADMGVTFDTDAIIDQAWNQGREGSVLNRFETIQKLPENPVKLTTTMTADTTALEAKVREVAASLTVAAVDAGIKGFDPSKEGDKRFTFTQEKAGTMVDADQLWAAAKAELDNKTYGTVQIQTQVVEPAVTAEELKNNTQLIARKVSIMKSDRNREENIRLACDAISGTVLLPGETFSFNDATGERTAKKGYQIAGVINNGKTDNGLGGGVCQVSGTLFNAAVMSDLEIVERTKHTYELAYLEAGQDATVDYGRLDLKFKNNQKMPIYIIMYSSARTHKVTAEIYGQPLADGVTIKLESVTTATYKPGETKYVKDSSVPKGTTKAYTAHTGKRVTTYKVYLKNGKEINRVVLHKDYYRAITAEIHYNPADPNPSDPTPKPTVKPTPTPTKQEPTQEPDPTDVVG